MQASGCGSRNANSPASRGGAGSVSARQADLGCGRTPRVEPLPGCPPFSAPEATALGNRTPPLLINLDGRAQTSFDEPHQLDALAQSFLQDCLCESIALQCAAPSIICNGLGVKFADFGNARGNLFGGGVFGRSDLLPQQLLVYQAIECSFALFGSESIRRTRIQKGLERQLFFPIALQQDMTVYIGDHPVHDLAGASASGQRGA